MLPSSVDFPVPDEVLQQPISVAAEKWLLQSMDSFSPSNTFSFLSNVAVKASKDIETNNISRTVIDKEMFKRFVIKNFEHFICGEKPEDGMEKLKQLNKPANVCGRQFGVGDPTFTCRDCATDQTCVFCNDCFHKSAHVNHRYKFHASLGSGGCCDCGDIEAWKQDPACEVHSQANPENGNEYDPLADFPVDVKGRAKELFEYVLRYCVDMICWKYQGGNPMSVLSSRNPLDATHHAVLFNDEVHTYDDVLFSLIKAIRCDQQKALLLASIVDKEGRSVIYSGQYTRCEKICNEVRARSSRFGKRPLVCEVIHQDILAHQGIALELMEWIYQSISFSDGLRRVLCQVVVGSYTDRGCTVLEHVLLADAGLWKVARSVFHQALMSGLMLDQFGKKKFSITFAKKYKEMMRLFIKDDHDHSVSATSMSVQIFTAPTMARMLMTEHCLLKHVIECFVEHIKPSVSAEGYINLQALQSSNGKLLKRTYYILHDLRYLLNQPPNEWNDALRRSFLEAMDIYLVLLKSMQNMDPVKRRLRSHIEYEPYWQDGYFLQLWLMPTLEAVLSWCASDQFVLIKTALKAMSLLQGLGEKNIMYEFHPGCAMRAKFDISAEYVSVHMALSRFIAGLIPSALRYNIDIQELLGLSGNVEQKLLLVEYPLRSLVLAAQVSAGMWTRNGFSLLNQVAYYQNVRCSSEMYDRDIMLLQAAATLLEANHWINIVMDRYGLTDWTSSTFDESKLSEDQHRFLSSLVKEFFMTVIAVVAERFIVGIGVVSSEDILKREVVHRLALGPCSRSELVKNLPCKEPDDIENCTFESQLDGVLSIVADFRKPGETGTGMYELKQEYYSQCAQFFYHYSRNEQSKILDVWRKISKKDNSPVVISPPTPPVFTPLFADVNNLLICSKFGELIAATLQKALQKKCDTISDTVIEEVMYLISYGIYEEQRRPQPHSSPFASLLHEAKYTHDESKVSIMDLMHELQNQQTSREYSDLLNWTLSFISNALTVNQDASTTREISTPKRKQSSNAEDAGLEKQRRRRLAQEKRELVMAQMSAMQKAFIESNPHFVNIQQKPSSSPMAVDTQLYPEDLNSVPIAVGKNKTLPSPIQKTVTCIVCQEEQEVSADGPPMVLTALVQRSMVLASKNLQNQERQTSEYNPLYLPSDMSFCAHNNSCGHVMHGECWQRYLSGRRSLSFSHRRILDIDRNEYLCPMCGSLCNSALPMLPTLLLHPDGHHSDDDSSFSNQASLPDNLDSFILLVDEAARLEHEKEIVHHETVQHPLSHRSFAHGFTRSLRSLVRRLFEKREDNTSTIDSLLRQFSHSIHSIIFDSHAEPSAPRLLTMSWATCSYTIQSIESYLAHNNKPLFGGLTSRQSECLSSLVAYAHGIGVLVAPFQAEKNAVTLWQVITNDDVSSSFAPSIIDLNLFGAMVNLRFALPFLLSPTASHDESDQFQTAVDHNLIQLIDTMITIQCLLSFKHDDPVDTSEFIFNPEENNPMVTSELQTLLLQCQSLARNSSSVPKLPDVNSLLKVLIRQRQIFLRCSAIFFRYLTNVDPPLVLRDYVDPLPAHVERQVLCSYLSLPLDPIALLRGTFTNDEAQSPLHSIAKRWCSSPMTLSRMISPKPITVDHRLHHPLHKVLIDLPHDYSQCINQASGFRCPSSGDASRSPALCLICGEMLCSQGFCCQSNVNGTQVGACTAHSLRCGDGVGMFFQVRDCEILLLYNKTKGCFLSPPYLDEYGEADHGFRRGNPLFLSPVRYESLVNIWRLHNIPETIARQQEKARNLDAYNWSDF